MSGHTLRMVVIVHSMLSSHFLQKQNPANCAPPNQILLNKGKGKICTSYFTNLKNTLTIKLVSYLPFVTTCLILVDITF